jgi:hypothetical protein
MPLFDPHNSQTPYTSTPDLHAQHPSEKQQLPAGCTSGPILHIVPTSTKSKGKKVISPLPNEPIPENAESCPIIWVDFPFKNKENPFYFSRRRKWVTLGIALYFAHVTALQTSAFSIGFGSMQRDLGMSDLQAAAGVALYGWVSLLNDFDDWQITWMELTCRALLSAHCVWHQYQKSSDDIGRTSELY